MDDLLRDPRLDVPDLVADDRLKRGDPFDERTFGWEYRHQLFSGFLPSEEIHQRISLQSLPLPDVTADRSTSFDIDSIIGHLSHLGKLRSALKILTVQTPTPQITSSLHLGTFPVQSQPEVGQRGAPIRSRPLHEIPQVVLGRLAGCDDFQVTLLFPCAVRRKQQTTRLPDEWYDIWLDEILLPAVYETLPSDYQSTFPTSAEDARLKSTLKSRLLRIQSTHHVPR